MHNKTTITQLGTCTVEIEHKKNKKCKFFIVPRNRHALLGMSDIDTLNIININIHSIGREQAGDSHNCYANNPTAQREDTKQETKKAEKCYKQTAFQNLTTKISQVPITCYLTE